LDVIAFVTLAILPANSSRPDPCDTGRYQGMNSSSWSWVGGWPADTPAWWWLVQRSAFRGVVGQLGVAVAVDQLAARASPGDHLGVVGEGGGGAGQLAGLAGLV
jgi:hypothetical protein